MSEDAGATPDRDPVLSAIAVLGGADAAALAVLLEDGETPQSLERYPAVHVRDGRWVLEPDTAAAILADLEGTDWTRYRSLHERAVGYLADRLRAGDATAEPALLAAFDRLASRLMGSDAEGFAALVATLRDVPIATTAGRHLRRYFEAVVLARADRYAEALAVLDELLADPALDDQVRGRALNSRAVYCRISGRLEEAVAGYRASLALWRRLGNRLREGMALYNLAVVAYQLQEHDEAERSLAEAARCFEAAGSARWLAAAQNELGLIERDRGRLAEALACFQAAAVRYRADGSRDLLAPVLGNIGEVLLFQGRLDEATVAFREALATMPTRAYAVDTHLDLGLTRQALGDLTGAREAYQEALDLALAIGRREALPEVYVRLGEVLRCQGDDDGALAQFEAAAAVVETTREPLRDEGLKISLLGRWQQVYEYLVLHCLSIGRPADAFAWAERARARAFADAVAAAQAEPALPPGEPNGRDDDGDGPATATVVTVAEVQARLPADTALLCYVTTGVLDRDLPLLRVLPSDSLLRAHLLTPARTLLFVVTRDRLTVHECPIDPNALTTASPRGDDRARFLDPTVLRRLHAALLEPAADALAAARLAIIPHGPLHRVPFAALADANGRPLVRTGGPQLGYAPSATVLVRHCLAPTPAPTPHRSCLAIGYDGADGERALRHTEREAALVAAITSGEAWVGPDAKKERLRVAARDSRWLHIACHGEFNELAPLESHLQTGAAERLTAREVLQDWRIHCELVTLSACRTGVSRILRGDEPMGLIRAFLAAGARATLVTQWPVEDLPTFLLMQRLYDELERAPHGGAAAALTAAQLWLRDLTAAAAREFLARLPAADPATADTALPAGLAAESRPFAHPRHWAAFILVGKS